MMNRLEEWEAAGIRHGWVAPQTNRNWLKFWPIRIVRVIVLAIRIHRHEQVVCSLGLGIPTGYDWWVLEGIRIGAIA